MGKPRIYKGKLGEARLQGQGLTAAEAQEQAQSSAPLVHGHAISDVAGLTDALNDKAEDDEVLHQVGDETKDGDLEFAEDTQGIILTDRTTATKYRLFVDGGVLDIEAI